MSRDRSETRLGLGRIALVLACASAALLAANAASAQRSQDSDATRQLELSQSRTPARTVQQERPITREEAVELVRMEFEGRVVSAETRTIDGRRVHVVRIFDDVRVRDIHVDAATGRILRR